MNAIPRSSLVLPICLGIAFASLVHGQDAPAGASTGSSDQARLPGFLGEKPAVAVSPAVLRRYVGTYVEPAGREATIEFGGDQLMFQLTGQPQISIYADSDTKFALRVVAAEVEFLLNDKGTATALTIHQGGHDLTMVREGLPVEADGAAGAAEDGMLGARASHWVAQWDAENWTDCWQEFDSKIQTQAPFDPWSQNAKRVHDRLGKLMDRKITAVAGPHPADGKPSLVGDRAAITFDASFEKAGPCSESIRLIKEPDGTWGIIGHLVRPKTAAAAAASAPAPANRIGPRPSFPDLAYATQSPAEKLDLYLPAPGSAPAPLVIWIHGGALMVGDKKSMPRQNFGPAPKPRGPMGPYQVQVADVAALLAKGYAVASLNYRLGPSMFAAAYPALRDAKAAVRFLRANADKYHLDPSKFAAWGDSAGGYLSAMLGVTGDQDTAFDDASLGNPGVSSAIQAVVVWFGAEDRLPDPKLDIVHYLPDAKALPPFRIVNGDADQLISPAQARRLNDALTKAGAVSTLTILPGAGHEDPAYMATQMLPAFAFLDQTFARH